MSNMPVQQNQNTVQKVAPRNNEYLEKQQQNKNFDLRGPSPAQATDTPELINQIPNLNHKENHTTRILQTRTSTNNQHQILSTPEIISTTTIQPVAATTTATCTITAASTKINENTNTIKTNCMPSTLNQPILPRFIPLDEVDKYKLPEPKIKLDIIKEKDQILMQESLTKFVDNSPDTAKKLGLIPDPGSLFSQMKADDGNLIIFLFIKIIIK